MTPRIGALRTEPDLPSDPASLPSPSPPRPPSIDPEVAALPVDESLWNFIEASRAQQKASKLAQLAGIASPSDVDVEHSATIRAYFARFNVEVPVLAGAPGETRNVAVPFRMAPNAFDEHVKTLRQALGSARSKEYVGFVVAGRATPDQLSAVVNDLARLHPEQFAPDRSAEDVRNYLRANGVGIDCAGSVQLALLNLKGLAPTDGAKLGLHRRLDEDLTGLGTRGRFQKITSPASLRPGDLIILKPPPNDKVGHTVIVADVATGPITTNEATFLSRDFPDVAIAGRDVVRISVASSFGWEGPQERTWIFDPATGKWGDLGGHLFDDDGHGNATATPGHHSGPWDHEIEGMFHAR